MWNLLCSTLGMCIRICINIMLTYFFIKYIPWWFTGGTAKSKTCLKGRCLGLILTYITCIRPLIWKTSLKTIVTWMTRTQETRCFKASVWTGLSSKGESLLSITPFFILVIVRWALRIGMIGTGPPRLVFMILKVLSSLYIQYMWDCWEDGLRSFVIYLSLKSPTWW